VPVKWIIQDSFLCHITDRSSSTENWRDPADERESNDFGAWH